MSETLLDRERLALARILVVVGQDQRTTRPAECLPIDPRRQYVQLDHVDAVRNRSVEARERVARLDQICSLVAHPSHAASMIYDRRDERAHSYLLPHHRRGSLGRVLQRARLRGDGTYPDSRRG